jgi:hypothetical protein
MVSIIQQRYHCKFLFLNHTQIQDCVYPEDGGIKLLRNVVDFYQSTRRHTPKLETSRLRLCLSSVISFVEI